MTGSDIAHAIFIYSIVIALGVVLGKAKVAGISLGATSFDINVADILPIMEDDSIFTEGLITEPNQLYEKK